MATVLVVPAAASSLGVIDGLLRDTAHDIVAADASPYAPGFLREGVTGYTIPRVAEGDAYRERLLEIVRSEDVDVFVPGSDRDVLAVAPYRDRFRDETNLLLPDRDSIETAADALTSVRLAAEAGVPTPETYDSLSDVPTAETTYPLVVKPRRSEGGRGVHRVSDRDALAFYVEKVRENGSEPVVQSRVPGGTGTMHVVGLLYDRDGTVVNAFVSRSRRTKFSWGGGGVVGEPVADAPELLAFATRIVDGLGGWVGPINMEFKIDQRNGTPTFIEINPRLWGYNYVATANGTNFPSRLVDVALRRDVEPDLNYDDGSMLIIDSVEEIVDSDGPGR